MSIAGLFAKLIDWPATVIIAGRLSFAFPFVLLWLVWKRTPLRLHSRKDFFLLIGLSALLTLHWVTYFKAIQLSTVAIAIVTVYTGPIITTFLEPLIRKTRLEKIDIFTALIGFAGIVIMIEDFTLQSAVTQGITLALLSALLMSVRTIYSRCFVARYSGPLIMFYQLFFGAMMIAPFVPLFSFTITEDNMLNLLMLALFATAIAHTLVLSSLTHISARSSGVLMMIQPLYAVSLAVIILGEIPTLRVLIGGILVVSATMFETYKQSRDSS